MEMMYEEFTELVKKQVEDVVASFIEPDEDLLPALIAYCREPDQIKVMFFPGFLDNNKALVWKAIKKELAENNAVMAAFVSGAWQRKIPPEDINLVKRILAKPIESYPIKSEIIALTVSDGIKIDSYSAAIIRDKKQLPKLEAWVHVDQTQGSVPEALVEGLMMTQQRR